MRVFFSTASVGRKKELGRGKGKILVICAVYVLRLRVRAYAVAARLCAVAHTPRAFGDIAFRAAAVRLLSKLYSPNDFTGNCLPLHSNCPLNKFHFINR